MSNFNLLVFRIDCKRLSIKWQMEMRKKNSELQVQEQDISAWQFEKERFADDRLFPFKEERGEKKLTSIWVS